MTKIKQNQIHINFSNATRMLDTGELSTLMLLVNKIIQIEKEEEEIFNYQKKLLDENKEKIKTERMETGKFIYYEYMIRNRSMREIAEEIGIAKFKAKDTFDAFAMKKRLPYKKNYMSQSDKQKMRHCLTVEDAIDLFDWLKK